MPLDPTCTSCNDKEECDKDWVDGHRFNWFICANCHRVMPCTHGLLVDISEQDLKGTCSTCCMRMPHSFVAEYLRKMYADKAAWFGRCAESIRKQEQEEREFIINFPNVETMPVTPGWRRTGVCNAIFWEYNQKNETAVASHSNCSCPLSEARSCGMGGVACSVASKPRRPFGLGRRGISKFERLNSSWIHQTQ